MVSLPHVRATDLEDHRYRSLHLEGVLPEGGSKRSAWLVHANGLRPRCLYRLGRRTCRLTILEVDRQRLFDIPIVRIQDDQAFMAFERSIAGRRQIAVGEEPDPLPELLFCHGLSP